MNNVENVYCCLCAELKPHNKLIDLQADESKCTEIITKLTRFNVQKNLGDKVLPKMVCDSCITSLNCAFDFVTVLEKAESKIKDFVVTQQMKQEQNVSKDDLVDNDAESGNVQIQNTEVETKQEQNVSKDDLVDNDTESDNVQIQNKEVESDKNEKPIAKPPKMKYKKRKDSKAATLTQMKLTWKNYKWCCVLCGEKFPTIDKLRTHAMRRHRLCNPFICTECKTRKVHIEKFVQHVRSHKPYLKLSCYICFDVFKSVIATNRHVKEEHLTSDYFCPGCNMSFEDYDDLQEHARSYKTGGAIWVLEDM